MTNATGTDPHSSAHPVPPEHGVLQLGPLHPVLEEALASEFSALLLPEDPAEQDRFLARHADGVRVAVGSGRTGVGTDLMRRLPRLEAVVHFGVGYDGTDAAEAAARGIVMSNTPDVLTDAVADTALALYLDVLRRFSAADRYVRQGLWESAGNFPLSRHASGRRVGVLGLGRIGRAVAVRLEALGCEIHYHNRRPAPGTGYPYHGSAAELAAAVDVLVVAVPGGPDSAGTVDAGVLAALGPDGFLVNVARGSVVDEPALVAALQEGRLGGAGLDVFADEPRVPAALRELDTVVLLPHVGSATEETRREMAELALRNLRGYLTDGTLVTPVA
ncbi:2-hydroxyacid dehydrogenase [Kocuria nitroreducens]|uniref:2-hydroxyacid dehydrogenase n=1 Tax=Kocuria nitroreducens TaxID=3058914 RepID=UPI0036D7A24C